MNNLQSERLIHFPNANSLLKISLGLIFFTLLSTAFVYADVRETWICVECKTETDEAPVVNILENAYLKTNLQYLDNAMFSITVGSSITLVNNDIVSHKFISGDVIISDVIAPGKSTSITLDSDGQHRIEDIQTVLEPLQTGKADIVIGSRFLNNNGKNVPSYRKVGIQILTKLANTSLEQNITDSQSGFRGYGKDVIENVTPSESGMGVSNEILIKASKQGLKIVEVPIIILYDGDTSTHNPISHGSSVLISTLKFISMEHPLKFYGIPGFVFLSIGLGFLIFTANLFTETRQILLSSTIIGIGSTIFGIILIQSSILLYAMVKLMKTKKLKKNYS